MKVRRHEAEEAIFVAVKLCSGGAKAKARRYAGNYVEGLRPEKREYERKRLDDLLAQMERATLQADAPKSAPKQQPAAVALDGSNGAHKSRKMRRPEVYALVTARRTINAGEGRCFYSTSMAWELWAEDGGKPARRIERLVLKVVRDVHQITTQEASNG